MKYLLAFAALIWCTSAYAQSAPWDSLEHQGARYAGTKDDRQNAVIVVCPVTGPQQLIVQSQQFRVSVPDDSKYTLTFVTDRGRSEVVVKAKDAELIYEAGDLNAQITLQRLMEDIAASKSFAIAMSPFGWKGKFTAEGAAEALKSMMGGC
jgi:hypothetical protein